MVEEAYGRSLTEARDLHPSPGCGVALPKSRSSLKNAAVTLRRCCLLEEVRLNSGMIGKIQKAHRYAEERNRFRFSALAVTIHGDNDDHEVRFEAGALICGCDFYGHQSVCAHTMAVERLLGGMLPEQAVIAAA